MPSNTNVTNLKINTLTEAQYDTAVQQGVIGANELSILTDVNDAIQVDTLPTAAAGEEGKIYQFIGTTGTYTNGYFYKCVSDGQTPATYSWAQVNVQPGATYTAGTGIDITSGVISVTTPTLQNKATTNTSVIIDALPSGGSAGLTRSSAVSIGYTTSLGGNQSVAVGSAAAVTANGGVAVGYNCSAGSSAVAIGRMSQATANFAIQLGGDFPVNKNTDANTFKVGNANGNYEIMSADGTIPADRLTHAINKYSTMPTASASNEGWIVQFTGATDSTYTHGHLYECVSDGADPATYSWTEVSMGGGSSYTAGNGISIDANNEISVTAPTLTNVASGTGSYCVGGNTGEYVNSGNYSVGVGNGVIMRNGSNNVYVGSGSNSMNLTGSYNVAIGSNAATNAHNNIAIGYRAEAQMGCIQFTMNNAQNYSNQTVNTFKVANANGNFEIMSADGTVPTARLTKVNTTVTLAAADWSSNTQTVNVTGMTATGVVFVNPDPSDQADYTSAGILCTAQAAGTLTFTCDTVPSSDIDVVVVML